MCIRDRHYGLGAFEGVRSYGSSNGDNVNIFRLKEQTERLFESAKIINVPINHNIDEVMEAQIGVISKSNLKDAYIRPLLYLNDERLGLDIVGMSSHLMISCWDWPTYFGAESIEQGIDVMVSSFTRQFPNSLMTKSKISGGYVNGVMAHDQAKNNGYQEAILLDTNGFVAEGSGQNIFIVKDGNLKIIDEIISEPIGGAHRDRDLILKNVRDSIEKNLNLQMLILQNITFPMNNI